jgi:hypothetical protein
MCRNPQSEVPDQTCATGFTGSLQNTGGDANSGLSNEPDGEHRAVLYVKM